MLELQQPSCQHERAGRENPGPDVTALQNHPNSSPSGQPVVCQKQMSAALTGGVQGAGRPPANQRVAGSILGQGTGLGCGPGPWLGCI